MKRVLPLRSNALTLILALSLGLGVSGYNPADAKTLWNPMNWFSGEDSQTSAEQAGKRAEAAQQAAERAVLEAQKALTQAQEAKRQAEALKTSPDSTDEKPVVNAPEATNTATQATETKPESQTEALKMELSHPPETTAAETKPSEAEQRQNAQAKPAENSVAQENGNQEASASKAAPKAEPWNPLTWFKKVETPRVESANPVDASSEKSSLSPEKNPEKSEAAPATGSSSTTPDPAAQTTETSSAKTAATEASDGKTQLETPSETKQQQASSETEAPIKSKDSYWNPMNWFSSASTPPAQKPEKVSAETTPATQSQPAAPEAETEVKNNVAVMETEKGNIAFELYPDQAPLTVANFTKLVNQGFYNRFNMKFHRVVPGFVIQTGDPTGTGAGGSKESVPLEAKNKLSHNMKGMVAMARGVDPNSASSQFYITLAPQTSLDGKYAIFGKVISGLDVLEKIEKDDMLYGIKLVDTNSIARDPASEKKSFFSSMF